MPDTAKGTLGQRSESDEIAPVWHSAGMAEVPAGNEWLSERETARVAGMRYPKRRSEFRLGRWTAKTTIARMLRLATDPVALSAVEIASAPGGAPDPRVGGVTAPVSISMSDRADWAVCLASTERVALGCDLELVEPRSDRFVADYLTAVEQQLVHGAGPERDLVANLIWSAKESALKVLRVGLRRDTRSVEVTLEGWGAVAGFGAAAMAGAVGWSALRVRDVHSEVTFPGWFCRFGDFLLTVAAAEPITPPAPLVQPPPLAAAVPTHAWMGTVGGEFT
ncbi:MAG: 4'-phosphopantetheinyl transferase family protein [Frankiaceae bacterium]